MLEADEPLADRDRTSLHRARGLRAVSMQVDERDLTHWKRRAECAEGDFLSDVARSVTQLGAPGCAETSIGVFERDGEPMSSDPFGEARRLRRTDDALCSWRAGEAHVARFESRPVGERKREELLWQR